MSKKRAENSDLSVLRSDSEKQNLQQKQKTQQEYSFNPLLTGGFRS